MATIRQTLRSIGHREEGATAVEYGIMVALIAAVIIAVVVVIGNQTKQGFDEVCAEMNKSAKVTATCPS